MLNQHIFNVKPKVPMAPLFAMEGLNWLIDEMKEQVRGLEMFHIRKQELNRLRFPVPTVEEQDTAVGTLQEAKERCEAIREIQERTKGELKHLYGAVLNQAFQGRL